MKRPLQTTALMSALAFSLPLSASAGDKSTITYHTADVEDVSVFYREAGPKDAPTIVLLHGFPSSSHMFRDLIPELAEHYHVIAPDYPGFGQSSAPDAAEFSYDFATLAQIMGTLTEDLGVEQYSLYMQDFGGPVGLRMALDHPDRIEKIIIQNATFHAEGWNPDIVGQFAPFWKERTEETEAPLLNFLKPQTTEWQYRQGSSLSERLSPDAWVSDQAGLDRPGNVDVQLEYLWNYQDNVANYGTWQAYLASAQPDTLIVWGQNDPFFTMDGVSAIQELLPNAETHLFDAGHFALETHAAEIGDAIVSFMAR